MNDTSMSDAIRLLRLVAADVRTKDGKTIAEASVCAGFSLWLGRQYSLLSALVGHLGIHAAVFAMPSRSGPAVSARVSVRFRQLVAIIVTALSIIWMMISRGRVLVYDLERNNPNTHSGSRMRRVYEIVHRNGRKHGMLVHSLFDDRFWSFLVSVRCPIIYAESVSLFAHFLAVVPGNRFKISVVDWSGVPESVRPLVENELCKIPIAHRSVKIFAWIARIVGLHEFVTHDDIRHTNEMLIGFKSAHVKTIVVQHGNFNYFIGLDVLPPELSVFPDYFCVASFYWLNRLPQLSPLFAAYRERLCVTGWLGSQIVSTVSKLPTPRTSKKVLIPYELLIDYEVIRRAISALTRGGYEVLFKVKPGSDMNDQLGMYGIEVGMPGIRITAKLNDDILSSLSAAIGVYSTLLDEMILSGIPVGIFQGQILVFDDKVESGIANVICPEKDIVLQIQALCEIPDEEIERRRVLYGSTGGVSDVALQEIFV